VPQKLNPAGAASLEIKKREYLNNEADFRFDFNEEDSSFWEIANLQLNN
jgi:transaldolase